MHPQERSSRLNTAHSAAPLHPSTRDGCLTSPPNRKPHFFHQKAMQSGGGGKTSQYYTHWHLAKHIEQSLSERDGLISGRPVPTQTTVLASSHCQHLRFDSKFSTLHSEFLFPLFSPHMICPCPRSQSVFHRLCSQS